MIVDESHVTLPQVRGMFAGDLSRKTTLVEHGFRLPSALDNRPLQFDEWEKRLDQVLFMSATPGPYEMEQCGGEVVEQVIRPTGLVDPVLDIRPARGQVPRSARRNREAGRGQGAGAGHDADQAHGRGSDPLLARSRAALQMAALRAGRLRTRARYCASCVKGPSSAGRRQPAA